MARVVAGAGAGFHWISLETQRGSSKKAKEKKSKMEFEKSNTEWALGG
jgi:hypothetical protein